MIRAFNTAATGMTAQQFLLDNTANNLANLNTTGYKRSEVAFQDLIYLNLLQPGTQLFQGTSVPTGLQIGNGVRVAGNSKIFVEGTLNNSGNPLDLAIEGDGFFQVTVTDGTLRYTRDGTFRLNANGQLVTADGYLLTPNITIPNDTQSIAVASDGTVSVTTATNPTTPTTVGQINLARFPNPAGLSSEGRNLYNQTGASGTPITSQAGQNGTGVIQQGFLEGSNVNVVTELVNLILAQRGYEFNTRAVRVADEMLQATTDLVR
jgi:flagellar basal-body rod protein FlgG